MIELINGEQYTAMWMLHSRCAKFLHQNLAMYEKLFFKIPAIIILRELFIGISVTQAKFSYMFSVDIVAAIL